MHCLRNLDLSHQVGDVGGKGGEAFHINTSRFFYWTFSICADLMSMCLCWNLKGKRLVWLVMVRVVPHTPKMTQLNLPGSGLEHSILVRLLKTILRSWKKREIYCTESANITTYTVLKFSRLATMFQAFYSQCFIFELFVISITDISSIYVTSFNKSPDVFHCKQNYSSLRNAKFCRSFSVQQQQLYFQAAPPCYYLLTKYFIVSSNQFDLIWQEAFSNSVFFYYPRSSNIED